MYVCVCVCIYIYIYIYREREREILFEQYCLFLPAVWHSMQTVFVEWAVYMHVIVAQSDNDQVQYNNVTVLQHTGYISQ